MRHAPSRRVRAIWRSWPANWKRGYSRVWVEGGAQVIRGMIAAGKLDVLEMAIVPIVLGDGIPLIAPGTPELRLTLKSCEPRSGGALHVVYEAAR